MKAVVVGLGRIGLPLALVAADAGINVTGIDIKKDLIETLLNKKIPFYEPYLEELIKKHCKKNFYPKLQNDAITDIREAEYIIITIGTEFVRYPQKPSIERLFLIIDDLLQIGIKNKTIVIRVTLPIGYTDKIRKKIETTGLKESTDFYLAFVPERIMEGKAIEEEKNLPKIIGCYSDKSFEKINKFFKKIGGGIIRVKDPKTAEFIKLIDNAWRNTRFAFANELAFLAEENDIDVWEAIKSANEGYERNQIPIPGPVSGYCLGKDPYILEGAFEKVAEKRGFDSVWYYGRLANDWLIHKIVDKIEGKKILVAGLSFKADIDDFRFSHGIEIVRKLVKYGYKVFVHDPFMDKNFYTSLPKDIEEKVKKVSSLERGVRSVDSIIFAVAHKEYKKLRKKDFPPSITVIDLWNIFRSGNIKNYLVSGVKSNR